MTVTELPNVKYCSGCGKRKRRSAFSPDASKHDGLRRFCKQCRTKRDQRELAAIGSKCSCAGCEAKLDPFTPEHFKLWASDMILDNGKPWLVEPWQLDVVADVFEGFGTYPVIWLVVPEANAKSTLVAGIAMYHEQHVVRARVGVAAASQEQAGIIFERVDSFVQLSELDQEFRCQEGNRRIHCDRTLGRIQIYASDARTGDGIIGSLLVLEELHRHRDLRLYRTWLGKLEKREAQMIVISTAGEPESEFEDERTMMRREADELVKDHGDCRTIARAPGRYVLHDWAVPKPDQVEDLEVVARANPLKVNTVAALTRKRNLPGWTLPHWKRFTCGLATRDEVHAVGELEWEAAHVKNSKRQPYPDIPQGEEVWLGLDFAWKWDTTALVPLWAPEPEFRLIGIPTILTPPRNGNMLPTQDVKEAIAALHERTPIRTAVADVSLAQDVCQWVEDELGVEVVDRGQSNPHKVEDYDRFMEALRNGWLWHCGDRALTRHVMNATAKLLPMGDTIFERPSASRHGSMQHRRVIDGLTAACHAHTSAAAELMLGEPLVAY